MVVELSRDEARRLAISAGLLDARRPGDVIEVAEQLGAVKIDPTATIAPAEHSILWSRIGWSYDPEQLTTASEVDRTLFEFDGAFRPTSLLPVMLPWMRSFPRHEKSRAWWDANAQFRRDVLDRLRDQGPLLASEIPDTAQAARAPDGWYGSNQTTIMLEFLQLHGDIAVVGRRGRNKVWDLAERVYPDDVVDLDPEAAAAAWEQRRLQAAGIAKQKSPWTRVGTAGETAKVEGSKWTWRVDPDALAGLAEDPGPRVAFLNPYDPLLFDRPRLQELFDFTYVLEQFKPKAQRVYGYFAYPILKGTRFIGMLEAEVMKDRPALHVSAVHEIIPFVGEDMDLVRAEIDELADWLGVEVTGN